MAVKLTAAQNTMLDNIKQHFPIDYFTREKFKETVGGRLPNAATLNKLVEYGYLELKGEQYRLMPEGADSSIATFAVEDKKTTTDAVSALFGVRNIIETNYKKIEHWMNNATYATEPNSQKGIYRIVDSRNGRVVYIGKTETTFDQRWRQHRDELTAGCHHCAGLQAYLNNELGGDINLLSFEPHEELPADSELIDNRERYWITYFGDSVMNTMRPTLTGTLMTLPEIHADRNQKILKGLEVIARQTAAAIHDYLYASVKLSDQNKATLIAGIVIALNDKTFAQTYKVYDDGQRFVETFDNAILSTIRSTKMLKSGHDAIYSTFDFIKHNENFKKTLEYDGKTYIALQLLTEIIESSICRIAKEYPEYDVMGDFYNEFAKYSGADQQALGIVLTPHHVADFMGELLEINENDTILDICCGTGALPIAAHRYSTNKIVGVEYQERMMALCLANMIMRNYQSTLYLGDSFGEEMLKAVKEQKLTKMIINPPYAQDGYPEMGFVRRGLDQLVEGGLGVAIVPMSCAIKSDKTLKALKEEILSKHQLLATFSMPDQLFYPVGVVTIVMLFRAHTPHEDSSFFGYLKDDGFEITRTNGRQDQGKWTEIKDEMLTLYRNCEEKAGISALAEVWAGDEWCCEAYMKTDYSGITPEMFIQELRKISLFKLNLGD
jgi:type I restriction-modification system DNA methylase subunit